MDRETRLQLWTDETAHPLSIATRVAMEASGADMSLASDWADLEGHNDSDWMCYLDFLKGAIGIAQDHDDKSEFDPPSTHKTRVLYLHRLWAELEKAVGEQPHNALGENQTEHLRYQAQLKRQTSEPISIISIPGKFYARYDVTNEQVLGFGFMPAAGDAGYFGPFAVHEDGPQPGMLNDSGPSGSNFWNAVRRYLENTALIGGEAAIHCVWTEDGWSTEPEG